MEYKMNNKKINRNNRQYKKVCVQNLMRTNK